MGQFDEDALLPEPEAGRLADLLEKQQVEACSEAEQTEVQALLAEYGRRSQEQALERVAAERGITVQQARHERQDDLDEARQWWEAFQRDPDRRKLAVADLKRRRRQPTSGT